MEVVLKFNLPSESDKFHYALNAEKYFKCIQEISKALEEQPPEELVDSLLDIMNDYGFG